jgi:hypothetical protein
MPIFLLLLGAGAFALFAYGGGYDSDTDEAIVPPPNTPRYGGVDPGVIDRRRAPLPPAQTDDPLTPEALAESGMVFTQFDPIGSGAPQYGAIAQGVVNSIADLYKTGGYGCQNCGD